MDPWIHGPTAGAAARAPLALLLMLLLNVFHHGRKGQREAPPYNCVMHSAAAPAQQQLKQIHGSISFIMNHIFYFEMKNH